MSDFSPTRTILQPLPVSRLTGKVPPRGFQASWTRMARWVRLIDTAPASKLYLTHVQLCTAKGDVVKLLANLFCSGFFSFFDPVTSGRQTFPDLPLSLADDPLISGPMQVH